MFRPLIPAIMALLTTPVWAHEFWIAPLEYQVNPLDEIHANFHVGADFKGPSFPYVNRRVEQTLVIQNGVTQTYDGQLGDRPAMQLDTPDAGLLILAHETKNDLLTYRDWDMFVNFVDHKDLQGALERHAERGLPQTGFKETYRRYAKSLVAVGAGQGADQRVGFDIEIVALANPYADGVSSIPVQVWYNDSPRTDAQVEIFAKSPAGTLSVETTRTNGQGIATVNLQSGYTYMIDNVALEERDGSNPTQAVWHSLWANLTFHVP